MFAITLCALFLLLGGAEEPGHPIRFRNSAVVEGYQFLLANSPTPKKHLPETMAGGVAAFDYNGDGLTDVFFANGAALPSMEKSSPAFWSRLYKNVGGMRFRDVTANAGLQGEGFSIAPIAADFDNDGHVDLFVAGVSRNILYRNRGDGTFEDVTVRAGISSGQWAVGGAWLDFDNDGLLDLLVVNYVRWTPAFDLFCGDRERGVRVYCHPRVFEGTANRLYKNAGGGRFVDASAASGIAGHIGKGMAAAVADYDGDGFPDIFVSNDKEPNFLFHNLRNGKFEEVALDAGVALPDAGTEMSSMGTEFRDLNNDGRPDIVVTALSGETYPLFLNQGNGHFRDGGVVSRMSALTRSYSGWGVGSYDFDNDGLKDLFTANSHVNDRVEVFERTHYKQPNAVFAQMPGQRFADVSALAGEDLQKSSRAHRGCAFADFNGDGRIDAVTSSLGEAPEFWENVSARAGTWLIVKLHGSRSNRDAIGAVIQVGEQTNHMTTSVGYASSSHFGVHFGTGGLKVIPSLQIRWPSGRRQELRNVRTNQVLQVTEPSPDH